MRLLNVADLHIHTTASDGAYSLPEVARLARLAGLEIIAVTDHDAVSSLDSVGTYGYLEIIPGVELSAELGSREVHILGYYINSKDEKFRAVLSVLQGNRRARLHAILERLASHNVNIDPQEVLDIAEGASVGRLHVAELLIDKGHAASVYEAFRDFLGPEGKAFVPKTRFTVAAAIDLVHAAGGAAILAHPGSAFTHEEIKSFAAAGLDGLEAHYPRHTEPETTDAVRLAAELDLVVTGGSDFHGRRIIDTEIGASRVSRAEVDKLHQRAVAHGAR